MTRQADPPGTAKECRSCKRLIVWVKTSRGKSMPCDISPDPAGTFYLFRKSDRIEAEHVNSHSDRAQNAFARGDKKYTSHFSTCPNADEHRRSR